MVSLIGRRFSTPPPPTKQEAPPRELEGAPHGDALHDSVQLGHWPSDYALRVVDVWHEWGDLPWWAAIAATTVGLRLLLLPISLATMRHAGRMQKARPDIDVLQARMKADPRKDERAAMYQRQMAAVLEKHDVRVWLVFAFPMAQLPIFTSMFFGLQRLGTTFDVHDGGALWFADLAAPDPYYVLPVATASLFLAMVEVGADGMQSQQTFKYVMRVMAFAMVPVTASFPSAVFCYWFTANAFSLTQTTILRHLPQAARARLGLPKQPPASKPPSTPHLKNALANVRAALESHFRPSKPHAVVPDIFHKRKKDNAYLASRPHASTRTYSHRRSAPNNAAKHHD